jgi:hypothetical protein
MRNPAVAVWKASPRQRYQEGPGVESEQPKGARTSCHWTSIAKKLRRIEEAGPYTHMHNIYIYSEYIYIYNIYIHIIIYTHTMYIYLIHPSIHLSIMVTVLDRLVSGCGSTQVAKGLTSRQCGASSGAFVERLWSTGDRINTTHRYNDTMIHI